jgi:hypothetical protein
VRGAARAAAALALVLPLAAAGVGGQPAAESYTATASVKHGGASASVPVVVTITRYSTPDERAAVVKALRDQGADGARHALARLPEAGFIELGRRRTPSGFAGVRPTGSGRLITVLTAEPILFLGGAMPAAPPRKGFDVAVAMFEVQDAGSGTGELAPAARVGLDRADALVIDDYGAAVIWLNGIAAKR